MSGERETLSVESIMDRQSEPLASVSENAFYKEEEIRSWVLSKTS
jgi:hypothetical protein